MTSQIVACPQCGTNLQNSPAIAGQVVACPQCQTQLQMPALPEAAPGAEQVPVEDELPPAVELPPQVPGGASQGPAVQTSKRPAQQTSVSKRLKKKSNPVLVLFILLAVIVLIGVGAVGFMWDKAQKEKNSFTNQVVGNWELVPGQAQLESWDFAFHSDGKFQMKLVNDLSEGNWEVTAVQSGTGLVLIRWPDDAPETMRVRFEGGTMQVELDSVGNYSFRAAVP